MDSNKKVPNLSMSFVALRQAGYYHSFVPFPLPRQGRNSHVCLLQKIQTNRMGSFFFFFLCSKGYAHPGRLSVFKSLLLFILQLPTSTVYNLRPYFQSWLAHAAWLITSSRDYSVRWPRGYTTCNFIIKTKYRNILYLKFPHPPPPKCKFMK